MKVRTLVTVVVASLLGACASPTVYDKPGITVDSFNKDKYECLKEARTPVSSWGINRYGGAGSSSIAADPGMAKTCMEGRGYHPVAKTVKG